MLQLTELLLLTLLNKMKMKFLKGYRRQKETTHDIWFGASSGRAAASCRPTAGSGQLGSVGPSAVAAAIGSGQLVSTAAEPLDSSGLSAGDATLF
jgi:hypothetical protein